MGGQDEIKILRNFAHYMKNAHAWPEDGEKVSLSLFMKCCARIIIFNFSVFCGSICLLYQSTKVDVSSDRLNVVANILELSSFLSSSTALNFIKGDRFLKFLNRLGTHKFGDPENIDKTHERQEKMTNVMYYAISVCCLIYGINNYVRQSFCEGKELYNDPRFICGMISPVWYPINLDFSPVKQLLLLNGTVALMMFVPTSSLGLIVVLVCVELIIVRIKHLKQYMRKMDVSCDKDKETTERDLLWCIKYHSEIIELVDDMNQTLGYYFVPQYSLVSTLLALLVYQVIEETTMWSFIHFGIWFATETLFCFSGQFIENEAESLIYSIYDIPWYDMHPELRSNYKIFLARAQMPVQLKAQPILAINNEYLYIVMKGSYSFSMYLTNF